MFINIAKVCCIIFAAYYLGSIPFGIVINKLFRGGDLRKIGSGSTGTTNVMRSVGLFPALLTLLLDSGKAILAILIVGFIAGGISFSGINPAESRFIIMFLAGFAAIVGHCYSPFLHFKGGKAVATSLGVIIYFNPIIAIMVACVWLFVFVLTRYVSLSSMLSAISYLIFLEFFDISGFTEIKIACFSMLVAFLIFRHKDNIKRLFSRTENGIYFTKKGREIEKIRIEKIKNKYENKAK